MKEKFRNLVKVREPTKDNPNLTLTFCLGKASDFDEEELKKEFKIYVDSEQWIKDKEELLSLYYSTGKTSFLN